MATFPGYQPDEVFGGPNPPRVFISPARYVQGPGTLERLGRYVQPIGATNVAILASPGRISATGKTLSESLQSSGIESRFLTFGGESSLDEIELHVSDLSDSPADALIALGGGKCIDTGKAVAARLGIDSIVVPTLASNDAPCSAVSVIYSPEGVYQDVEFYPDSPALVVVDSEIVANAPERYLVAGMGDAMATWYEARVAIANPAGRSSLGVRPTLAAAAIGQVCAETLYESGVKAAEAVRNNTVDDHLEAVIEANTLLSGLGFESGGLASAHGTGMAFTAIGPAHDNFLHGEMVAFGVLAQLVLEGLNDEAARAADFFCRVGLPVTLDQLMVEPSDDTAVAILVAGTLGFPPTANLPFEVTPEAVEEAIRSADSLGAGIKAQAGDRPYLRLRPEPDGADEQA